MNTVLHAVQQVRADAGEPLHYREITKRALSQGLWATDGKTPVGLMNGKQLVILLIEHGIGVRRTTHDILALKELQEGEE